MANQRAKTAKHFMQGRSQAVYLPEEIRFECKEVLVWKGGDRVILQALDAPVLDVVAWRARLDAFLDVPFADVERELSQPSDDIPFG
jgi:antitoxin VapB